MSRTWTRAAWGLVALFAAVALWNATSYSWPAGYDAAEHRDYALLLVDEGALPRATGEYYTPPGFYAVAGAAVWLGRTLGIVETERVAQIVNALLATATGALLILLARELWPDRPRVALAAVAFFAACPLALKAAAMFHPEVLDLFLCTAALLLVARMIVRRSFGLGAAVLLGLLLGAAQLVRAFSLWTVAIALAALAAAALAQSGLRRAVLRALAVTTVLAALVPAPWYVHQARQYSNPIFDRPQPQEPLWERRPASFYLDLGLPELVTASHRPEFSTSFMPVAYAETWGDYFGVWAWGDAKGAGPDRVELGAQAIAGILPTLLAVAGWIALLALALRLWRSRPELVAVSLLPLAALCGLLYFTVAYPTPDGDTIKGLYMLTALPTWALSFGFALDLLIRRPRIALPLVAALLIAGAVSLRFGVYAWT